VSADRRALLVATYGYRDAGLRRLTAPAHDAEALAAVLEDPAIAGFDVTMLVNEPHHVVGEAIADFYGSCRREDLTLLYFTGHGLKDDDGRLYLAMTDTRRDALMFTSLSAAQISDAMDACRSRRKVLVLDCCYSGAFPAGRTAKSDEGVQTLERFQGKGRAVLTASDATQYAFEGDHVEGSGTQSLFTRFLVEAIRTGEADLDRDGDIALDELYSYVRDRVTAEAPQQRPKKQEDVDGRIVLARNVHWRLPDHVQHAIDSPIAAQRLSAVEGLGHLHRVGNEMVGAVAARCLTALADDDSRAVSAAASAALERLRTGTAPPPPPAPAPPPQAEPRVQVPEPPPVEPPRAVPAAPPAPAVPAPPRPTGDTAGPRLLLPLALLLVADAVLVWSRFALLESNNRYRAADLDYSRWPWLLGVMLPALVATGIALGRAGPLLRAAAAGLSAGAALSLLAQTVDLVAYVRDDEVDYALGPGWWLTATGVLLLAVCAGLLGRPFSRSLTVSLDWPALLGALAVLAGLAVWISRYWSEQGTWLPVYSSGLVLAAACLPATLVRGDPGFRVAAMATVTTTGIWVAGTQVWILATGSYWTDAPDAVASLLSGLVMVAAADLTQFVGGRPAARSDGGPTALRRRPGGRAAPA
jgi:hypothetical protein